MNCPVNIHTNNSTKEPKNVKYDRTDKYRLVADKHTFIILKVFFRSKKNAREKRDGDMNQLEFRYLLIAKSNVSNGFCESYILSYRIIDLREEISKIYVIFGGFRLNLINITK